MRPFPSCDAALRPFPAGALRLAAVFAALGVLGVGPPARAAQLPFVASLALQVGLADPVGVVGTGVATVNGAGPAGGVLTQLGIAPAVFTSAGLSVPVTGLAPVAGVEATLANATGAFARSGGALAGPMGLTGVARLCLFLACTAGPPATLALPLSAVGVGGSASASGPFLDVTVSGAPWTTGAVTLGDLAVTGFARGPGGATGTTARPGGLVRLVTPIFLETSLADGGVPAFGILTLQFVPEPGTAVLLGAGIAGLVALGRGQRRTA